MCISLNFAYLCKLKLAGTMLDPQSFVRHLHTDRENQTCHWGFDASHWRSYVHIADIYYKKNDHNKVDDSPTSSDNEKISPEKAQSMLDEIKKRFNHPKLSRKHVSSTIKFLIWLPNSITIFFWGINFSRRRKKMCNYMYIDTTRLSGK